MTQKMVSVVIKKAADGSSPEATPEIVRVFMNNRVAQDYVASQGGELKIVEAPFGRRGHE